MGAMVKHIIFVVFINQLIAQLITLNFKKVLFLLKNSLMKVTKSIGKVKDVAGGKNLDRNIVKMMMKTMKTSMKLKVGNIHKKYLIQQNTNKH